MNIVEYFLGVNSKQDIHEALTKCCHENGFERFIYTPLLAGGNTARVFKDESRVLGLDALIAQNTLSDFPDSWARRYQEAQYVLKDPVIGHLSKSVLPIFWSDANRSAPSNVVMGEASEHGLHDGITVSLYGHGGQRAALSFTNDGKPGQSPGNRSVTAGLVQLAANYAYEALWKLESDRNALIGSPLSVREKDCLQWAALGKTSWEIAQILNISERTVIFHFTNAAKKLNATNRRQAVVRALTLRLINP